MTRLKTFHDPSVEKRCSKVFKEMWAWKIKTKSNGDFNPFYRCGKLFWRENCNSAWNGRIRKLLVLFTFWYNWIWVVTDKIWAPYLSSIRRGFQETFKINRWGTGRNSEGQGGPGRDREGQGGSGARGPVRRLTTFWD